MLDITSLYHAVFQEERRKYDPKETYFSILIDMASFDPLYQLLRDRIGYLLPPGQMAWIHKEDRTPMDRNELEEALSKVVERLELEIRGEPPKRRYYLFSAYSSESQGEDAQLMETIRALDLSPGDVITVLLCFSSRMEDKMERLKQVAFALENCGKAVDVYLFEEKNGSFYRRVLIDSISAAVVMNTEFSQTNDRKVRQKAVTAHVKSHKGQLTAEGVASIETYPSIYWSTICARYYDRRHDFLVKYVADACNTLKLPEKDDFDALLHRIYKETLPRPELGKIKQKLRDAIDLIPYVTPNPPKTISGSLYNHFIMLYGNRGLYYVDLTLSTMLSRLVREECDEPDKIAAHAIFDSMAGYHQIDLMATVCSLFEDYIARFRKNSQPSRSNMEDELKDEMSGMNYDSVMNGYIEKHYHSHLRQIELLFWEDTLRYIRRHPGEFKAACDQARAYYDEIEALKAELRDGVQEGETLCKDMMTAQDVLTMAQSAERCVKIRSVFEHLPANAYTGEAPSDCKHVFGFDLNPNFIRVESVDFQTGGYTIYGKEYNGQYIVPQGGE